MPEKTLLGQLLCVSRKTIQVCDESPLSAHNMTLTAFAAERRRACSTAPEARPQPLIDISCPQGAQQQTRWPPLLLSIDGSDRRGQTETDARPFRRPCSAQHSGSVKNVGSTGTVDHATDDLFCRFLLLSDAHQ